MRVAPSSIPTPTSSATGNPAPAAIGSAEEAIAAVVAVAPRFAGFGPEKPGQIGDGPHVVIATVADGWELTFVTGSGDCMSGCIEHGYTKYRITRTAEVTLLCQWATNGGTVVEGRPC